MLTDPDGRFVPMLIFAGAFMGGLNVALKGGTGGQFFTGAITGGLAGAAGGAAAALAPAGILSGFAFGAGTGAAIGAGQAALTGGNVGKAALWGGIIGGVTGGINGGLVAAKYGANIWTGKLPVHDYVSASGSIMAEGSPVGYNDKDLNSFAQKQFPKDMKGLNKLTMQQRPSSYKINADGSWTNKAGEEVLGSTAPFIRGGKVYANAYISRAAFGSQKELFLTLGHELTHTQHYFAGLEGIYGDNFWYNSERAALDWNYAAGIRNRWYNISKAYEIKIFDLYRSSADPIFNSKVNVLFIK